ncbi:MAG: hypothetical protein M3140_10765 [Actinomycetota bacterium]|nr:hypothetical protein [Actinomycetota bacterium]
MRRSREIRVVVAGGLTRLGAGRSAPGAVDPEVGWPEVGPVGGLAVGAPVDAAIGASMEGAFLPSGDDAKGARPEPGWSAEAVDADPYRGASIAVTVATTAAAIRTGRTTTVSGRTGRKALSTGFSRRTGSSRRTRFSRRGGWGRCDAARGPFEGRMPS